MHIFYTPDIHSQTSSHTLPEEESKHCVRVMRLTTSDRIMLIDGRGGRYIAEIVDPHPKHTLLNIVSFSQDEPRQGKIHLVVAPTKNIDRYEWFLEKATEIGLDEITPIICEHSERKAVKLDRLAKVLIAAMKQSKQSFLPQLNQVTKLSDFLNTETSDKCFIAHCEEDSKSYINEKLSAGENAMILIGPEGDFSSQEIAIALDKGYVPISLGSSRLRTETAAVVACIEVALINR
ncbi:16S rRNA (uracil(1498)-N(3))-methyltransferase [Albibacterium profundi]|uniref:Ribosomal RNA small subunit methyltransferase E n=1 Tax=Albibacterium profundi TaxID=3134906 RepID=A0ABV5CE72_9SPHI